MKRRRRSFMMVSAFYTLIGMWFFWKPVLLSPQKYLFGPGGDGVKNYFTPLYHILYGDGNHFTGMNYPFGEHVAFTDAQPLLSNVLQSALNGNPDYMFNVIALMNLLILASVALAAMFIYRILALWEVPHGYSAFIAAAIALLSPQIHRFTGHYGLAYVCFFPMLWYYLAAWFKNGKWLDALRIFLTAFFFGGLHAYYLALSGAFIAPAALFFLFTKERSKWLRSATAIVAAVLPLGLYLLWLQKTGANIVTDRHPHPYGFFTYTSGLREVFLPEGGWVLEYLRKFIPIPDANWEGIAYIGIPAMIAILVGLIFARSWKRLSGGWPSYILIYGLAASICFSLSMALPFKFLPQSLVPELLEQFRALGRFSWPMYYFLSITAAFLLYRVAESVRLKGQAVMAMAGIILFGIAWYSEGLQLQKKKADYIIAEGKNAEDFLSVKRDYKKWLSESGKSPADFQAILAFPFFNIGSEELYIERDGVGLYHACKASLSLQLPIAETFLGRTSLHQSLLLTQLLSHPLIKKEVLDSFPNQKPLLLITATELSAAEANLVKDARLLNRHDAIAMYELPLTVFQKQRDSAINVAKNSKLRFTAFLSTGDTLQKSQKDFAYWQDFEFKRKDEDKYLLWNGKKPKDLTTDALDVSLWIKVLQENAAFPLLMVEQWNTKKERIGIVELNPKTSTDIYKGSVLVSSEINLTKETDSISIYLSGKELMPETLLIKQKGVNVRLKAKAGEKWWNNYPF